MGQRWVKELGQSRSEWMKDAWITGQIAGCAEQWGNARRTDEHPEEEKLIQANKERNFKHSNQCLLCFLSIYSSIQAAYTLDFYFSVTKFIFPFDSVLLQQSYKS